MDGDCQMLMRYNLYYLSFLLLVNCCPWRREIPLVMVRFYSSLIYALTSFLFYIYWNCMYFKFNCMLSNYLFEQHLCFDHLFEQGFLCCRWSHLYKGLRRFASSSSSMYSKWHIPLVFHQSRLQIPTFPGFQHSFSLFLLQKINFLT